MLEEKKLVGRILNGDPEAADAFVTLFRPRLLRASHYFLGHQDADAEDIVQDTFMVAFPKLQQFDFRAPIYAWLRQICLRLCYARIRRRGRVHMTLQEDLELQMQGQAIEKEQAAGLEHQKQERLVVLQGLKKDLGAISQEIVELRNVQGLSYVQISKKLGIPMGTVMSRLSRGRDQLRVLLEERSAEKVSEDQTPGSSQHRAKEKQ